jgi:hypothetical protein
MSDLKDHDIDRVRPVMWFYDSIGVKIIDCKVCRRNPDGSFSADIENLPAGEYLFELSCEPGKLNLLFKGSKI